VTCTTRSGRRPSGRELLSVGLLGLVGLGIVAAWISPAGLIGATDALVRALRNIGFGGAVVVGILQVLVAASGILPASLLGVVSGAIYGLVPGFLLAAVSTMAGAVIAFFLSRSLFRPTVERVIANRPRLRNFDALIAQDGWRLVCLLRISPVMPFSVTSYMLGLSSIDLRGYTIGTLASLPALCGYVFIGTLADASLSAWMTGAGPLRWILLGIGGVATLVLTVRFGQILRKIGFASQTVTTVGSGPLRDDYRAR
jgi:uncharacterized membrane protein YdjX (TVP38/TMEM64 family)